MDIMSQSVNQELIEFLDNSPTCFQAVENFRKMLKDAGYSELLECEKWEIVPGGKYFVTRNDSSIIAFSAAIRIPRASRSRKMPRWTPTANIQN